MNKRLIICLEGPDGCGKTIQCFLLHYCLKLNNISSISSREPGGSKIGESLREILLSNNSIDSSTNILLYSAIRLNNIKESINPALENNKIVILDRYLLSTLVYQGQDNKILIDKINLLHKEFNNNLYPNLTLVLKIESETAVKRINFRLSNNFYDKMPIEYHKKIMNLYEKEIKSNYKGNTSVINANLDMASVHKSIIDKINNTFNMLLKPLNKEQISKAIIQKEKNNE